MDTTMSRNNMSVSDQKAIANLSFEKYLSDSIESFKAVRKADNDIIRTDKSFEESIKLIKKTYQSMSKESVEAEEMKMKFGDKVKNWFIKVWSIIAEIFSKLSEIVLQLVKALIIFIQKKRIQATSIINMMKDKAIKGMNLEGKKIYETIKNEGYEIRTLATDISNDKNAYRFNDITVLIKNNRLKEFIKSPIITKNKDSIFNTESLKKYFEQELIQADAVDEVKMDNLENAINYLYSQGVLYGEVSPNHIKTGSLLNYLKEDLDTHNISAVAHKIVMGTTSPKYVSIPLTDFFGSDWSNEEIVFREAWMHYVNDTKITLDNGGYISTIEEMLKRYKDIAVNDNKNIKMMKDFIVSQLEKLGNDASEKSQKIQHKVKRFTKLILGVKNIKNHFIRLRQSVILDIITLYSMENRAWYLASGKKELIEKYQEIDPGMELPDNTKPVTGKRTLKMDLEGDNVDYDKLYRQGDENLNV